MFWIMVNQYLQVLEFLLLNLKNFKLMIKTLVYAKTA